MKYPEFTSDIFFGLDKIELKLYVDKILIEPLKEKVNDNLDVQSRILFKEESTKPADRELIFNTALSEIYVSPTFIENHSSKSSEQYKSFISQFDEYMNIFKSMASIMQDSGTDYAFSPFNLLFKTEDNFILKFLFHPVPEGYTYITLIEEAFGKIEEYLNPDTKEFNDRIAQSFSKDDGIKYLRHSEGSWQVLNPLFEVADGINDKYRADKDHRIKKPHLMINQENLNQYLLFDSNWVLEFDGLETMLVKPNDVALYSNIADSNLARARTFYNETILVRHKQYGDAFPTAEKQKEYYDYFEFIIQAVIFAYTAIESFANICIPNDWQLETDKAGIKTIYSKEAIERKFPLRDKFKKILSIILKTPDVTKEDWWGKFIALEEIRNELIHTKQSKSENRYSTLLSKSIFELIENHKAIINYYGKYIAENRTDLLDEYPYNFGQDHFVPGLMTAKGYERSYKSIRNITLDSEEE